MPQCCLIYCGTPYATDWKDWRTRYEPRKSGSGEREEADLSSPYAFLSPFPFSLFPLSARWCCRLFFLRLLSVALVMFLLDFRPLTRTPLSLTPYRLSLFCSCESFTWTQRHTKSSRTCSPCPPFSPSSTPSIGPLTCVMVRSLRGDRQTDREEDEEEEDEEEKKTWILFSPLASVSPNLAYSALTHFGLPLPSSAYLSLLQ